MAQRGTLTPKQQQFVDAYLRNGRNATAAYRAAYSTSALDKTVGLEACKLLKHPGIAPVIAEWDAREAAKLSEAAQRNAVTKERISSELARIAFGDESLGSICIRDRRNALMDLARLHGYIVERKDVRIVRSIEDLSNEELAAIVASGERKEGTRH